jgi:hypothetical protein
MIYFLRELYKVGTITSLSQNETSEVVHFHDHTAKEETENTD